MKSILKIATMPCNGKPLIGWPKKVDHYNPLDKNNRKVIEITTYCLWFN